MSILDIFQINKIKAELQQTRDERDALKNLLAETERLDLHEIKKAIQALEEQKRQMNEELTNLQNGHAKQRTSLNSQIEELNKQITDKKSLLIILDDEALLQSFGFYKPRYNLQTSQMYKARLEKIREKQATMVKNGTAAHCPTNWTVNNSQKEGERMIKDYTKLILRSFNNECDASIINIKFNNVDTIEKKIRKAFETLNTLAKRMNIYIATEYLNLKLEELYLCYEYEVKKQEEKEEQKRVREQMREEAKLLKELEEVKLKLEKEEKHFNKAMESVNNQLQKAQTEAERVALEQEKAKIQNQIDELEKNKLDVQKREQNTRAGYVYIISNIGAFGENIYKIGVTRRLVPEERVDELGDASVPFDFDIHALIFSDDAPKLENALHRAFQHKRLNLINARREFFHVTLEEIEKVVKTNFSKPVEFVRLSEAAEYRQSLALREGQEA